MNLFFILSGFVLALPYDTHERAMKSSQDIRLFYKHRFLRLVPLFWFSVVFLLVFVYRVPFQVFLYKAMLLMSGAFVFTKSHFLPDINGVLWSLGDEFWFSALFPFLVILTGKFGIRKVVLWTAVVALAVRFTAVWLPCFYIGNPYLNPLKDSVLGRLDDFVVGMLLAQLYCRMEYFSRLKSVCMFLLGVSLVGAAGNLWNCIYLHLASHWMAPLTNILVNAGFSFITLSLLLSPRGFLRSMFSGWLIQVVGMMCYSIYIWHAIILSLIARRVFYRTEDIPYIIVATLLVSVLSYRFIEFGTEKNWRLLFKKADDGPA